MPLLFFVNFRFTLNKSWKEIKRARVGALICKTLKGGVCPWTHVAWCSSKTFLKVPLLYQITSYIHPIGFCRYASKNNCSSPGMIRAFWKILEICRDFSRLKKLVKSCFGVRKSPISMNVCIGISSFSLQELFSIKTNRKKYSMFNGWEEACNGLSRQ